METQVKNKGWLAGLIAILFFWALFILLFVALLLLPEELLFRAILGLGLWGIITIVFTFLWLSTPRYYVFTHEGLTVQFIFGFYKYYAWKTVSNIYRLRTYRSLRFMIEGEVVGKEAFFTKSCNNLHITKTTEALMQKYWKKPIKYKDT